jgi:hypothetical protein
MNPPRTALYRAPRPTEQSAAGRRGIQAVRKAQANVIAQCDGCGATDDAEHRVRRERHEGCVGRFRFYGVQS